MPKLTKRAIRYVRTDGPTLVIEKLRFLKMYKKTNVVRALFCTMMQSLTDKLKVVSKIGISKVMVFLKLFKLLFLSADRDTSFRGLLLSTSWNVSIFRCF